MDNYLFPRSLENKEDCKNDFHIQLVYFNVKTDMKIRFVLCTLNLREIFAQFYLVILNKGHLGNGVSGFDAHG